MRLQILKSGILTTVQDSGRRGFARFGINPNGAMDRTAARLINVLLGNDENEAVLEMHFPAAEILFEKDSCFALGGADFAAKLGGDQVENWRACYAKKGSVLKFSKKISGSRAYFSIRGGFEIKDWLGSASTNLTAKIGGFDGRKLQNGDRLSFKDQRPKINDQSYKISASLLPFYSSFPTVRIVAGAEFESLAASSRDIFLKENFVVSQNSDRMGFRLHGEPIELNDQKEIISSAVNFGTIQLLPDGQMILLMADHQTSGGYPRIANVISVDLPLLAQLGANDKVAFHLVSIDEAENLALDFERNLNFLKIAVNFLK